MEKDRVVSIVKWTVLIGVVPLVLAILIPRESTPRGNVKPITARKAMPDFKLHDLGGASWQLSAHKGDVVLVNFWATWCAPCRQETPGLIRIARRYGMKGLAIAGVNMDEGGAGPVRDFVRDFGVNYPVMRPDSSFLLANEIDSLPTTFLIDRKGRIARTYIGEVAESVFRADIESLLAEPKS